MIVMLWAERWRIAVGKGMTVLAVGAAVLTLAACGGAGKPATRTYTIHGTVTMVGYLPADCRMEGIMQGYYSDLREGAKIVVKDLSGAVLATTALGAPKPSPAGSKCDWTFAAHVPAAKFYTVTIPHGGEVVVSFSQLEKDGWSLQATAK